ncbi:UNKNOWN [Stylonychia lemnae]|uniref:Uncharacterized protein n=1 Tax=Stylonychia lemnae TaxID=5949 RepID=A0A078ALW3_STYLE|nr:UNKNOWN [Stylonychia lemnae]|eukprot:CDW81848.1 UNKNOWN [Stylonychia lemnae]
MNKEKGSRDALSSSGEVVYTQSSLTNDASSLLTQIVQLIVKSIFLFRPNSGIMLINKISINIDNPTKQNKLMSNTTRVE